MSKVLVGKGKYLRTPKHREDAAKRAKGNTFRLGKPHTAETKAKISAAKTKHADLSYTTIHRRINELFPKSGVCERCGSPSRDYHSRTYTLQREDWEELCVGCHRVADRE